MLRPPSPPFAVAPATFRFRALASLAGRLPIGAGRETALAALLSARLAAGALPSAQHARPVRVARAAAMKQWLTAMCPDVKVRAACAVLADATAEDDPDGVVRALQRVIEVTAPHIDAAARAEFTSLASELRGKD